MKPTALILALAMLAPTACGGEADPLEPTRQLQQESELSCATGLGTTLYVSPTGSDSNPGTCSSPLATLSGAHEALPSTINQHYTIYVRGGTYYDQSVTWKKTSPLRRITIEAYPGEEPIFDGRGKQPRAFQLSVAKGEATNVHIIGITWRHYVSHVIQFRGGGRKPNSNDPAELEAVRQSRDTTFNGSNVIGNNTFEENGSLYRTTCGGSNPCRGFGAVDLVNSRNNTIIENVFYRSENTDQGDGDGDSKKMMHAIYAAHHSHGNHIYNNTAILTSGSPIKLRDYSNDNLIHQNYLTDSGSERTFECPVDGAEQLCRNNELFGNISTFGYPWPDPQSYRRKDPIDLVGSEPGAFVDVGMNVHDGSRPTVERVGGMTTGDLLGTGDDQLVVGLNYQSKHGKLSKIVATQGGAGGGLTPCATCRLGWRRTSARHLSRLLFVDEKSVGAMTAGRFDGSGRDQLITYLHWEPGSWAELWRGSGGFGNISSGAQDLGRIYRNDNWKITALVAGNFDGTGADELLAAFRSGGGTSHIYRGNGRTGIGSSIWSSTSWNVRGLAAAELDGIAGLELITARFQDSNESLQIYAGNGVTSTTSFGKLYQSSGKDLTAIAAAPAGKFTPNGKIGLFTAIVPVGGGTRVLYRGHQYDVEEAAIYSSSSWDIAALATGRLHEPFARTLVTAFDWPSRTQIWGGDGVGSGSTDTMGAGTYHRYEQPSYP